jgi:hypothetical protein
MKENLKKIADQITISVEQFDKGQKMVIFSNFTEIRFLGFVIFIIKTK